MINRYNDQANRVIALAQEEARQLRHAELGTEDLLIALMLLEEEISAVALKKMGVTLETVRKNIQEMQIPTSVRTASDVPFTEAAKKSLAYAPREALQLGQNHVGPEHLLLGILREDPEAAKVVYGVFTGDVRKEVVALVTEQVIQKAQSAPQPEEPTVRSSDEISAEIDALKDKLRKLQAELDEAEKRVTGVDPDYHH